MTGISVHKGQRNEDKPSMLEPMPPADNYAIEDFSVIPFYTKHSRSSQQVTYYPLD